MPKGRGTATLDDLLVQLRISNRLLAAQLRGSMKQNELVVLLSSVGATEQEIADTLDTTAGTVHTTIQRHKRKPA